MNHPAMRAHYALRYDIAKRLQPKSIVEIGVRAGYSAFALLSGAPKASYLGIDSGDPAYDRPNAKAEDFRKHARWLLSRFDARIEQADSQHMTDLPRADLISIDGDHTYWGAAHDIELALAAAPFVLVDDTDYIPDVRHAVLDAGCNIEWLRDPLRGAALLTPAYRKAA